MNKKTTGILLILLANIVLLVYAVVSHHHHYTNVCFEDSHCIDSPEKNEHQESEHNHKHDENNDNCVLKQVVVVPLQVYKQICSCDNDCTNHNDFQLILFLSNTDYNISFLKSIFSYTPFFKFRYTFFVNRCFGLRAPPIV
jgi:hypothetical protein